LILGFLLLLSLAQIVNSFLQMGKVITILDHGVVRSKAVIAAGSPPPKWEGLAGH
jgi:hypothetical protein